MSFTYEGDLAADAVAYRAKMAIDLAAAGEDFDRSAFEDMELRLNVKRVGE